MDAVELTKYIQNPETISVEKIDELRRIVESYPVFQAAMLLYMKGLWNRGSKELAKELERVAISIPDRRCLYVLLNGDESLLAQVGQEKKVRDSFDLVNAFLSKSNEMEQHEDERSLGEILHYDMPVASEEYLHGQQQEDVSSSKLKHQELIDSFLESNSSESVTMLSPKDEMPDIEECVSTEDEIAIRPLDKSYFTETLARIYVKQKRYSKALQIIKNLNLKYPEKNVYFADQIRFLEKLIINTKK